MVGVGDNVEGGSHRIGSFFKKLSGYTRNRGRKGVNGWTHTSRSTLPNKIARESF